MKMKERPKNRLAGWIGSDNEQKVENQIGMGKQKLQYIKIPNEVKEQKRDKRKDAREHICAFLIPFGHVKLIHVCITIS